MIVKQLPLAIRIPHSANFDAFKAGENALLVELLQQCAQNQGELQLYVWGVASSGKTHLLQASCQLAASAGYASCYLPLRELLPHSAGVFDNLESVDLLCLDELEVLAGKLEWEQALFSLINRCRAKPTRLVLAANANVTELGWKLPDLSSRLTWGPVFQLHALKSDQDKINAIQMRAHGKGMILPDDVAKYILSHYSRDIGFLCKQIDVLDEASLAAQRRLTIPFVKSVLS